MDNQESHDPSADLAGLRPSRRETGDDGPEVGGEEVRQFLERVEQLWPRDRPDRGAALRPRDPRLEKLLSLCEALKNEGKPVAPAEICRDCPELLAELQRCWEAIAAMQDVQAGTGNQESDRKTTPDESLHRGLPSVPAIPGYEVLGVLGQGGMGVVYKARQVRANRLVALKMILRASQATSQHLARFRIEAEAAARLQHAGIAQVYEVGEQDGQPFFSLEFCAGGSLKDRLREGPLPAEEAARVVALLADALAEAHARQVLHRDLKPANVLLVDGPGKPVSQCRPKIADFGLAKKLDDPGLTTTEAVMGTPSYMAPEQAAGKVRELGPACDIYALGAILYECLTGRPPFQAATSWDTVRQVIEEEPVPPRRLQSRTPADVETICLKCLHKDPKRRYGSAGELAEDLRRFLNREPIRARPVGVAERTWRWCRRNPGAAVALAVTGMALGVLVPGMALLYAARTDKQTAEKLARSESYHARLNEVRQRFITRPKGWIESNLRDLGQAARLDTEACDPVALRSEVAATLAGVEIVFQGTLAEAFNASVLAFSPDGRLLAAAQAQATLAGDLAGSPAAVLLIDPQDRVVKRTLSFSPDPVWYLTNRGKHDGGRALAFSANGRYLALGTRSGRVFCWDLHGPNTPLINGQTVAAGKPVAGLLFGPDGRSLMVRTEGDKRLTRWKLDGQHLVKAAEVELAAEVWSMALSPDGLLLACHQKDQIVFLDPDRLTPCRAPLTQDFGPFTLQFSPDGRFLAGDAVGRIHLTDLETGSLVRKFQDPDLDVAHEGYLGTLLFSGNGALLLSASFSENDRTVKLWEVCSGRLLDTRVIGGHSFTALALHPLAPVLAVATDNRIELHQIAGPRTPTVLGHHAFRMGSACFSPDGQFLAGLDRKETALWSLSNGRRLSRRIQNGDRPDFTPAALAFHPRGTSLVFQGPWNVLCLWDLAAIRPFRELKAPDAESCAFSPSGKRLWAVVDGDTVQSWTWPEGQPATRWRNVVLSGLGRLQSLVAADQWVLVGGRDGGVRLLRPDDGQLEATLDGPGSPVRSLAIGPNGSWAAIGTQQGVVRLVSLGDRQTLADLTGHQDSVEALAFSRDGAMLASGSRDRTVRLYGRTGSHFEHLLTLRSPSGPVRGACFHPDGKRLGVLIQNETALRIWDLDPLRRTLAEMGLDWQLDWAEVPPVPVRTFLDEGPPTPASTAQAAAARSEDFFLQGDTGAGLLWLARALELAGDQEKDLQRALRIQLTSRLRPPALLKEWKGHDDAVSRVAFSPDGKLLATSSYDGTARILDAATNRPIARLNHDTGLRGILFLPDGQRVLTWTKSGAVRLWQAGSGIPIGRALPHPGDVYAVAVSPDGNSLATGCRDNRLRLWSWEAFRSEAPAPTLTSEDLGKMVLGLAYSPDGRTLLVGLQGRVEFWDVAHRRFMGQALPHAGHVDAVPFSPDGRTFATATKPVAQLWDAQTRRPIGGPMRHLDMVEEVVFSRDGEALATASDDETARLWDSATSLSLSAPLPHSAPVWSVAFTSDGTKLATGCKDGKVRLWPVMRQPLEGDVQRIVLWAQVQSGLELTPEFGMRVLTEEERRQRWQQLNERGGPPLPGAR